MHARSLVVVVALVACASVCSGFYLPGVAPTEYERNAEVNVKAEQLSSVVTQLPFEYSALPFCKPKGALVHKPLNLGELLHGSRIVNTPYNFHVLDDEQCKILCITHFDDEEIDAFTVAIQAQYKMHLLLDNLPAALKFYVNTDAHDQNKKLYDLGVPIGDYDAETGKVFINNHLRFTVLYHADAERFDGIRIVGFEAEPFSIEHTTGQLDKWGGEDCENQVAGSTAECKLETCGPEFSVGVVPEDERMRLDVKRKRGLNVIWTYDVLWIPSPIKWASRWDTYLSSTNEELHWFAIANSVVVVLVLSGLVGYILLRSLRSDLLRYAEVPDDEEMFPIHETGWKLVASEVFRVPEDPRVLCVVVGSGTQIFLMLCVVVAMALGGLLSPANRGALMETALFIFAFMGIFGGYVSARLAKSFGYEAWKRVVVNTAIFFPAVIFVIFFGLNLVVWGKKSSGALPFGTLVALLLIWIGIEIPLVLLGGKIGFRRPARQQPIRTAPIPRPIPPQPMYLFPLFTVLGGGALPFFAVSVEVYFVLTSIFSHQIYYLFGFLFLSVVILAVTTGEVALVSTYLHLCSEDYHWHWRAFYTGAASGICLFMYSLYLYTTALSVKSFVSSILYFGYMGIASITLGLATGAVAFLCSRWFVYRIYTAVKGD